MRGGDEISSGMASGFGRFVGSDGRLLATYNTSTTGFQASLGVEVLLVGRITLGVVCPGADHWD